jgi:hypothetical protein
VFEQQAYADHSAQENKLSVEQGKDRARNRYAKEKYNNHADCRTLCKTNDEPWRCFANDNRELAMQVEKD